MPTRNAPVRGRRYKYGEPLDVKREVKFTESQNKIIEEWQMREGVSEVGDLFRETLLEKASGEKNVTRFPLIPMLGEIPGGPLAEIKQELPDQYVQPPFDDLPSDCYALKIRGDSMEDKYMSEHFGLSAPDGFYAFFAPGVLYPTMVAHVEISNGQFEHSVTLKKIVERGDDIELRPINNNHKPIIVKRNTVAIKGGFIRAWDGKSK